MKKNAPCSISAPIVVILATCLMSLCVPAGADEGMWTFDNIPVERIEEQYGFTVTRQWLDHVRLASVRFNDGGSGSFVSPHGLVVTNHHVAMGQLQKMSSETKDYVADGFYAGSRDNEIPCADLELNVLVAMENVTARVLGAMKPELSQAKQLKARDAEKALIQKESLETTGLRSDVVTLYHGGEYWLYRYRKYTDVRLVMAPERQAASFGGDFDNFAYPRYDLDFAFFRIYEDGKPLEPEYFFRWSPDGPAEDELVFISGNPGSTGRLLTMRQLRHLRDLTYPGRLHLINSMTKTLKDYAALGSEQARRSQVLIYGQANSKKAYDGMLRALNNEKLMALRQSSEDDLRDRVRKNADWNELYGPAWHRLQGVYDEHGDAMHRESMRQRLLGRGCGTLLKLAVNLVLYVEESGRPDGERLDGFHDSELEERRFYLYSPAPVYPDLEAVLLGHAFHYAVDQFGIDDPLGSVFSGYGDPQTAARSLTGETRMADVEFRKSLMEGGAAAVNASKDPLIVLARRIAPLRRADEEWRKEMVESVVTPAAEQIARARFAVLGKAAYPDATFTLRLSYGQSRGYPMNGTLAPHKTILYGMFGRSLAFEGRDEFRLPDRFWKRIDQLDLATPVNFASSLDTIGGNSGSPVINRHAELVGINFDRNVEGLSNAFLNDPVHNRNVAVHSAVVLEVLRKLYDAGPLADELMAGRDEDL